MLPGELKNSIVMSVQTEMLKIKCDINQQDLKRVDLHFVKSE